MEGAFSYTNDREQLLRKCYKKCNIPSKSKHNRLKHSTHKTNY